MTNQKLELKTCENMLLCSLFCEEYPQTTHLIRSGFPGMVIVVAEDPVGLEVNFLSEKEVQDIYGVEINTMTETSETSH